MLTIPSSCSDIGEQLSNVHAEQKIKHRQALFQILSCLWFLCRQGLALRGDGTECDSNFQQLLRLKASDDSNLADWLKRKENVYTSPDIQNEIIKVLGNHVLQSITKELQSSAFLTVMADETTDCSNKEQVTMVVRHVADNLEVHEEFLGLFPVKSTDATTLTNVIKKVFEDQGLSLQRLRGQCYDGASAMSGIKSGVAKQICDIEPRALFTHCYGHALNLAASDVLKQSKLMSDALDLTREITKLIKCSPRREGIFQDLKEKLEGGSTQGIRVLCPTRWTVKANSLTSILNNYETLQDTWEEALTVTQDTEPKARIHGVSAQMCNFDFFYGCMLGELILKHADNLSSTLQHKHISAAEGQQIALMTLQTIKSVCTDEMFDLFWAKVTQRATDLGINDPQLPRCRKRTRRYDDGHSEGDFHSTPKAYFRQSYYEAIDLVVGCIENRFDQPGYRIYRTLESLLLKVCKQDDIADDLEAILSFYKDDFDHELLPVQLETFGTYFQQTQGDSVSNISVFDVKSCFLSLSHGQRLLLSQVEKLLQLIFVMPSTNATSERSFSALRRLKSYLRTMMSQERLNFLMLLYVHKDRTDALDLKRALNDFVDGSVHRLGIFAKY